MRKGYIVSWTGDLHEHCGIYDVEIVEVNLDNWKPCKNLKYLYDKTKEHLTSCYLKTHFFNTFKEALEFQNKTYILPWITELKEMIKYLENKIGGIKC